MSSSFQSDTHMHGTDNGSTVNSSVAESIDTSVDESIEVSHDDSGISTINPAAGNIQHGVAGPLTRLGALSSQLPNLEPHQHSTLFYLSLIEGRCRSRAVHLLNEGRHPTDHLREDHPEVHALARPLFAEMSKELHKAGILPDDFAGEDLEDLRAKYLNTFDAALHNIATKITYTIPDQNTGSSNRTSNAFAIARASRASAMEKRAKSSNSPGADQPFLSSIILRDSGGEHLPTSIFQTQYGPKTLLGKGGFGHVFLAKNLVDDQVYAIKRIVIRGMKVNLAGNKEQQQALLIEARSLSKLNHHNIVRYFGAWVETCLANTRLEGDGSSEEGSYTNMPEGFDEQPSTLVFSQGESDVFERGKPTTTSTEPFKNPEQIDEINEESSALVASPSSKRFRDPNSESEDNKIVRRSSKRRRTLTADLDAIIFIKMDPYAMSLEDFLWPSQRKSGGAMVEHCFHTQTTIQILLAILDGIEYIHSQGMVHRDLKPGNILLSIESDHKPLSPGWIDIQDCAECNNGAHVKHYFIRPHIGDFGLAAEMKKLVDDSAGTPRGECVFEPTELARLAPAGSKLYMPETPVSVICPKLDVYSLGIITLELLYSFSTKAERFVVLGQLKQGVLLDSLKDHAMASGIKAMICANRDERWACSDVRKWLKDLEKRYT